MSDTLDAAGVRSLVTSLATDVEFSEYRDWIDEARGWYLRTTNLPIPGMEQLQLGYHPPKLMYDVSMYVKKFLAAKMDVTITATAVSKAAAENAQHMQNYWYRRMARMRESGVLARAFTDMTAFKRGFLMLHVANDLVPFVPEPGDDEAPEAYIKRSAALRKEFEEGKRGDLIETEYIPCDAVRWAPDRSCYVVSLQVPLSEVNEQYGPAGSGGLLDTKERRFGVKDGKVIESLAGAAASEEFGRQALPQKEKLTLHIVATDDYLYHYVCTGSDAKAEQGALLGCYTNPFGVPPVFEFSGEPTGRDHPRDGALSLVEGLYEIVPMLSVIGKLVLSASVEAAQQARVIKAAPGAEAAQERQDLRNRNGKIEVRMLDGGWITVSDGYDIFGPTAHIAPELFQAWTVLMEEATRLGFPQVLAEPQELSATSGLDRGKAEAAVESQLDPPLERIGNTLALMLRAEATAIKTLKMDVPVRNLYPTDKLGKVPATVREEIVLGWQDIGDFDAEFSFDAKSQYSRIADEQMGLALIDKGLMFTDEFLEQVRGIEDVDWWHRQKTRSDARKDALAMAAQDARQLFMGIKAIVEEGALQETGIARVLAALAAGGPPNGATNNGAPDGAMPQTQVGAQPSVTVPNGAGGGQPFNPPQDMAATLAGPGGMP